MTLDLTGDLARRRGRGRTLVVVLLLAAGVAAGAWWLLSRPPAPDAAAQDFADAWDAGDPGDGRVTGDASASWERIRGGTGEAEVDVRLAAVTVDEDDDASATADLEVAWSLPGDRTWRYTTAAPMRRDDDGWYVVWSAAVAHPDLDEGAVLEVRRTAPRRGDVLAEDGTAIVTTRPTVAVGIEPSRVDDVDQTVATVRELLDLELEGLEERVEAADPDRFVPVVTLREADYEDVRDELQPVPGTVFQRGEQLLAPTREFARATLGQAGPVTAELVEEQPERYQPGDVAGLSGLQRTYDEQLGGRPGLEVRAVPEDGDPQVLFTADPEDGTPVTVSLDPEVQRAADEVLAGEEAFPTAIVVLRVSDGHVLAVANGPGADGLDLALTGRYPPGSTFKVVTAAALLEDGTSVDATVACPPTATVDGRAFRNAEDAALGDVPLRTAFAESCNTAFVQLAAQLGPTSLRDAAVRFGVGHAPQLGVPAYTGDVPPTEPGTDQAAAAIGQGRVLLSPLAVADLAATVARGARLPPRLVLEDGPTAPEPEPLPDAVAQALPDLTRAVVTDGSGRALADVPGEPVHAKTGTAEYGDEAPPRTHAWVTGYQGDLAFAVLVAETPDAFGGQVAAPLAAELLTRLADR